MRHFRFKHIANRFLVWILGACLLIFFGFAALLYQQASTLIRLQTQDQAELAVNIVVQKIETVLANTSHSVRAARSSLLNADTDAEQITGLLQDLLQDNPEIFGIALALEPDVLPNKASYAPYAYREGPKLALKDLGEAYDYRSQPWYREPILQGRSLWSAPYLGHGAGGTPMVTYSSPIIATGESSAGRLLGVITADISLQTLSELIAANPLDDGRGHVYVISADAQLITHPDGKLRMAEASQLPGWEQNGEQWLALIDAVKQRQRGNAILPCLELAKEQCWLSYEPLENSNWSVVARIPMRELESGVRDLTRWVMAGASMACGLLTLLILALSRTLSRPVNILAKHTEDIARGDIDKPLPAFGLQDEVGLLADNFGKMQADLKRHIKQLTEATSRRERLQTELAIASRIQAQMLPDGGHSHVRYGAFELLAAMRPAQQVGGDLYLYQRLDTQRLFFIIGDVSDKGVPAALFMAQCVALIRGLLGHGIAPSELLAQLNRQLAINNENCMFVTAIAGLIDTKSGSCSVTSAGHPAPLLVNDHCRSITMEPGPALGLQQDATYIEVSLSLKPGDTLFLYTDGVDEAIDANQVQLGQEGLHRAIEALQRDGTATLVEPMMEYVIDYQQGLVFDDITLMTISRNESF